MLFAACAKDHNQTYSTEQHSGETIEVLTATVNEFNLENGTKSSLVLNGSTPVLAWDLRDQLGFLPANVPTGNATQCMFYIAESGNDAGTEFRANGWGLLKNKKYYSYYPYNAESKYDSVPLDYTGQRQSASGSTAHLAAKDYLHSYAVVPAEGKFELNYSHIGCIGRFTLRIKNGAGYTFTSMELSSAEPVMVSGGLFNPSSDSHTSYTRKDMTDCLSIALGENGIACPADGELVVFMMMNPANWQGKTINVKLNGNNGGEDVQFKGTITPKTNQAAGKYYAYSADVKQQGVGPEPPAGYTNLSENGAANCYIVSEAGKYCFRADIAGCDESAKLTGIVRAAMIWSSVNNASMAGDVLKGGNDIFYDSESGYICFETLSTFKQGNALIAALVDNGGHGDDVDGWTVWSWHIWCVSGGVADNDYGDGIKLMDRNIGALNNTPGSDGSFGMMYQWGRKEPFTGRDANGSPVITTAGNAQIPLYTTSRSAGTTKDWAVRNPYYYVCATTGHWEANDDLTLWGSTKTKYDPCPPGYRVPDMSALQRINAISGGTSGWYLGNGTASYFWPQAGYRPEGSGGALYGNGAQYWSNGIESFTGGYVGKCIDFNGGYLQFNISYAASAHAVRCQKIQ